MRSINRTIRGTGTEAMSCSISKMHPRFEWRECPQIHQHRVRGDGNVGGGHPPRILMAVELLDAKQPVGIRHGKVLRQSFLQVLTIPDKGPGQPPVEKFEELVRFECAVGQIDTTQEPYRAQVAPPLPKVLEEPLRAPIEAEHAKAARAFAVQLAAHAVDAGAIHIVHRAIGRNPRDRQSPATQPKAAVRLSNNERVKIAIKT